MAELLLVRSGATDSPVTERFDVEADRIEQYVGAGELHYLGAELPPIGETSRVSEFSGPDHVVMKLSAAETKKLQLQEAGYYVIEGLSPYEVEAG